jgi:hypothetical protein
MHGPGGLSFLAEALMLLSAPALVVTLSVQIWLFTRRGVFRSGRTMRAAIALASTIVTVPIVTLVLWMMMASLFTPPAISVGPASFIPGFIACLIVGIPLTWWGIGQSGKRD